MHSNNPLLLETIKIEDGKVHNLHYHQKRCNKSRFELYGVKDSLNLKSIIQPPKKGLYRCRILYHTKIHSIEYILYQEKEITTLQIIHAQLTYAHKYANRDSLDKLRSLHSKVDDILIEHNGYIQDTSIANIAFYDGGRWITPHEPLLKGTMRQKLLDEDFLHTQQIKKEDLHLYTQVALINAMIGFKILKNITIYSEEGTHYDY